MTTPGRKVHWSQHVETQFLVSSTNELRLCEYFPSSSASKRRASSKTIAVTSDLPGFKSLAWSPDPKLPDLAALGLLTGRTILLRINEVPVYTSNPHPSILHLNVRHPRPCNVVAFSPTEPNLLVTGYDKVRDNSLLIWDINHAFTSSSSGNATSSPFRPRHDSSSEAGGRSRPSPGPSNDPKPIAQFGLSEQVSAAAFLHSPRALVSAMALKWIRCYDLRQAGPGAGVGAGPSGSSNAATAVMNGRNIVSLEADPFDAHRFASVGEDGMVRLWDLRNHTEPLLTFSSDDGIAKPASDQRSSRPGTGNERTTTGAGGGLSRTASRISLTPSSAATSVAPHASGTVVSMAFSKTRRGHIATLDRDANHLSAWNIFEVGLGGQAQSDSEEGGGALMLHTTPEQEPPTPLLYYERQTSNLSRSINSFAFVPGTGGAQRFVTINKEGNVEFCEVKESPQVAFDKSGQFAYSIENRFSIEAQNLASPSTSGINGSYPAPSGQARSSSATGRKGSQDRLFGKIQNLNSRQTSRQTSPERTKIKTKKTYKSGRRSGRSGDETDDSKTRSSDDEDEREEDRVPKSKIPLLEKDISIVMRQRALEGYGLDPIRNRRLCKDGQAELWSWIEHAATMSTGGRAFIDNTYDFGFKGVLPILKGFAAYEAHSTQNQQQASSSLGTAAGSGSGGRPQSQTFSSRRSRTVSQPTGATAASGEVKTAISRSDTIRAQDASFARAAATLNKKNGSSPFTISSKPAQRQLALSSIGPDFASGDVASVIKRYESQNQPSKAAAWALFSGNIELAIRSLRNNKDERLKLLAPILATYLSQRDQAGTSTFKELCSGLSTSLDDPFMRAIFAYLASGDWTDVLEEDALPLKDRIGVALRFLPDEELNRNLESMAKKATASGELEGLLITGLDKAGFSLLQSYVDRTGDVQTAALAGAFVHPGQINDVRVERWIESYRSMLDHWKLYTIRARFDIARGSKMRSSMAVKGSEESSAAIGALLAPPHMLIRCHFCNETIAPKSHVNGNNGSQINNIGKRRQPLNQFHSGRTTRCPNCSKSFPRCSICLESIEVSTTGAGATPAWCWCQRCRHGGHAAHILEWFRRGNDECPVADCDCNCQRT